MVPAPVGEPSHCNQVGTLRVRVANVHCEEFPELSLRLLRDVERSSSPDTLERSNLFPVSDWLPSNTPTSGPNILIFLLNCRTSRFPVQIDPAQEAISGLYIVIYDRTLQ